MLIKQSIDPFIDNHDTKALDPLVAFAYFLTSGQQSIISIGRWDDPTVTKLHLVTMEIVKNDKKTENDKMEALQTICQATQSQFEKIMTIVFDNPSQAHRYADAGRHYSASIKRKYDTMKQGLSNTPSEVTTPMELPKGFDDASSSLNSKYKKLIAFIDAWK
ncbi:hypothetical protein G6F43_001305 [Rhizopus delemar]|nr:hypothetical protein G6F43_001305 [Rhizopus delemar]